VPLSQSAEAAPIASPGAPAKRTYKLKEILISVVAIGGSVGIAGSYMFFRHELRQMGDLGYLGVFIINLLSSATLFVPAPGFIAVAALGGVLNPLLVGIAAGAGASLGETTGYLAGIGGKAVLEDRPMYQRLHRWIARYGPFAIFVMAALPNPLFDIGGLIAGMMGMPIWQFVLATFLGKSVRFIAIAIGGSLVDLHL
jgi:membrane protein YqaA with SNARE-associated domain